VFYHYKWIKKSFASEVEVAYPCKTREQVGSSVSSLVTVTQPAPSEAAKAFLLWNSVGLRVSKLFTIGAVVV